jgi:hypothetical protein
MDRVYLSGLPLHPLEHSAEFSDSTAALGCSGGAIARCRRARPFDSETIAG